MLRIILIVGVLTGIGCSPPSAETVNLGDYCAIVAASYCNRAASCSLDTTSCDADFLTACCSGAACTRRVSAEQADACSTAFSEQPCAQISAGTVPGACQ